MFRLPPQGHKSRDLFDLSSLAETLSPANASDLITTLQARRKALDFFAACPHVRRVCFVVVRADSDERWLISFGPRGGWRKEWNFGNGRP